MRYLMLATALLATIIQSPALAQQMLWRGMNAPLVEIATIARTATMAEQSAAFSMSRMACPNHGSKNSQNRVTRGRSSIASIPLPTCQLLVTSPNLLAAAKIAVKSAPPPALGEKP